MTAALVSVWQGGLVFDLIWLAAAIAVGLEWQLLIAASRPRIRLVLASLGLVLCAIFAGRISSGAGYAILASCGLATTCAAGPGRRLWAFAGLIYAGSLLMSVMALHGSAADGTRAVLWLFAIVWGTDVFAYFGGRLIGGAKLWPRISPSKTWSGTLTGVLAGALIGVGVAASMHGSGSPARSIPLFALGLAAAAISQGGDIFESWIKRRFGVKDSSGLIPGHGGFMDRLDGFIAAAVFAASVGALRGHASIAAGLFDWF
jgi:phosphatidate cytidylyltransferase